MILYKCDMCGKIHEKIDEMANVDISHAGKSMVIYPRGGKFQVCEDCEGKLLETLNAWGVEAKTHYMDIPEGR